MRGREALRAILTLFVVMLWCVVAGLVLLILSPPPAETTSDTNDPTNSIPAPRSLDSLGTPTWPAPLPYCVNGEVGAQWEHPGCQFHPVVM